MLVQSNISGVLRQLERLQANVPVALDRALAPRHWLEEAKVRARKTLLALADPAQRKFIDDFVEQTSASILEGGGLVLRMGTPFRDTGDPLADAQAARAALSPFDGPDNLFLRQVTKFEDLILKWVETQKNLDARDAGKSDDEIARLISYIMLSPNLGEKGKEARKRLTPHIEAFIAQQQQQRLDAATVDLWLRAVLAEWRELLRRRFPGLVREELRTLKGELM